MFKESIESIKAKITPGKKGDALHKALMNKINKKHMKEGIKEAHKRIKKDGVDFNKI